MQPLINLIRKDTSYRWGDLEDWCFNELKRRLEKAMVTGFLKLSNGSNLQELVVFVDWSKSAQCAGAVVFVKEYGKNTLTVAYFWSRLLSDTFKNKPPFMCELASVCLFFSSNKYILAGRMITVWCDNLVASSILKRRLSDVDIFDNPIVNRLLLNIANVPFEVHYVTTKSNVADVLSRFCSKSEQSFEEILNSSVSVSDLGYVDQETYEPDDSIQSYLARNKLMTNLVKKRASEDFDVSTLKTRFTSHIFGSVNSIVEVEPSESDIAVWKLAITQDVEFKLPNDVRHQNLNCENLFEDPSDSLHDNMFRTSNKSDLIHFIVGESKVNQLGPESMIVLREDSNVISQHEGLSLTMTNGMDGIMDNDMMDSRQLLGPYLQELNVVFTLLVEDGKLQVDEPLFADFDQLKSAMDKYQIAFCPPKKLKYFVEIQNRSREIALMKKVLENVASEEEVNYENRISSFFNQMFTTKESFFIKDQLLFKLRFPKKGEKHSFCLVLEAPDCERKMAQIHTNLLHRGYIFLNAAYNVMFYTPG